MKNILFLGSIAFLLLGCSQKKQIPEKTGSIYVGGCPTEIVSEVRNISNSLGLSFHYGMHPVQIGANVITITLVDRAFEIDLLNPTGDHNFLLDLYIKDSNSMQKERAIETYNKIYHYLSSTNLDPRHCSN